MKRLLFLNLIFFISSVSFCQQNYYWVGGSGDWSDFANHWATTSGGSEFHTTAPDETNDVIFDENSFDSHGIVTFLNHATCRTFDASGIDVTVDWEEFNNGLRLMIHGSLLLSNQARVGLSTIEMEADDSGHIIDLAGVALANLYFDGQGSWELMDDLDANALRINESGILNTNDHNINLTTEFIAQIPRGIGEILPDKDELILGSSIIQTPKWEVFGTLLLDAGTSTIITEEFYPGSIGEGSPLDYHNLEMNGENGFFFGSANFNQVEIVAGTTVEFIEGSTIASSTLILNGTEVDSIKLKSMTLGAEGRTSSNEGITELQVTSGEVNGSYLSLTNIHGTGGATFNAYASKDNGGNDGWNFLKFDQTIIFDPLPVKTFGDENFELMATGGGSGNPITYTSSNESVATISGSTVSIVGVGNTIITATQMGNEAYNDATATQELQVMEKPLGIQGGVNFKIYPNPTRDILKIMLDFEKDFQVTIIGIDGGEISQHQSKEALNGIEIGNLNSGVYIIEVATPNMQTIRSRLIVEK
ncbi:T9SS type A sorting domain-containing protein [Ekhidna sp.]|uniref:T9SS type A sorting domain-containing protein n=1 Tax=Ekhidna sp. TaxID=2608089 RepID=UPI003512BF31